MGNYLVRRYPVWKYLAFGMIGAGLLALPAVAAETGAAPQMTRVELLNRLLETINAVPAYDCRMKIEQLAGERKEQNQILSYKQPGHVVITQLGPFKEGAVVEIKPDGKITAKLGGFLGIFPVSVGPDSGLIKGVTGDSAVMASYQAVIRRAIERAPLITEDSVTAADGGNGILLDYKVNEPINHFKMLIDARQMVIIRLERFKGDEPVSRIIWTDIHLGAAAGASAPAGAQ